MRGEGAAHPLRGPVVLLLVCAESSFACNIPVFRYALEYWPAAPYLLSVAQADQTQVEEWVRSSAATIGMPNLEVQVEGGGRPPGLAILPPEPNAGVALWSGSMEREVFEKVVDSPARRRIVDCLVSGQAAAWVLLEGATPEENQHLAALLEGELARLEKELRLPVDPATPGIEPAQPVFSVLPVSRTDPAEAFLVQSLLAGEPDLAGEEYAGAPMAFPIFGRGRLLYALVGAGITPRNIEEACRFVVGPCSCQVKDLNPGFDLLLAADWSAVLETLREESEEAVLRTGSPASAGQGAALRNLLLTMAILSGVVLISVLFFFQRERIP